MRISDWSSDVCSSDLPNGGEATVTYTDRPALIRDFGPGAREDFDGELRVTQQLGNLYISLGGGYRRHQLGNDWHLAQSYAASQLGNWAVYGGFVAHWWGPGTSGSLLFSSEPDTPELHSLIQHPYAL